MTAAQPGRTAGRGVDLLAGLTVTLVGLPQCVAYALLAGLPPAYGLSTAAVAGFVAALVGRSAQIVTGPTNTTGLLVLAAIAPWLGETGLLRADGLPALATLTLLAGAIRLALAWSRGAELIRFLPESVLVGFTAGAAVLIGAMQLDEALGLPPVAGTGLRTELAGLAVALQDGAVPALPALLLAAATMALLVGGAGSKRVPLALVGVIGGAVVAWVLGLDARAGLPLVGDRVPVPSGWPAFALPDVSAARLEELFLPASAIALLGTLELAVTARAGGARPQLARELQAQGWANVAGALAGAFPASASLARSALLRQMGAGSRLAAASAALLVLPVLLFGAFLVGHIPQASLAAVLLATAWRMIDRPAMARLWRASHETRLLLVTTLVSALLLPLPLAILFGAGLGLVIHLARTGSPRLRLLSLEAGRLVNVAGDSIPDRVVLEVSGSLHYAAVPPFVQAAERMLPDALRLVVIDLSHAHEIRYAALLALEQLADETERAGARLVLAGVSAETEQLLQRAASRLRWYPADPTPGESARIALEDPIEATDDHNG